MSNLFDKKRPYLEVIYSSIYQRKQAAVKLIQQYITNIYDHASTSWDPLNKLPHSFTS